ncbi:hypothetical protein AAG906_010293 [Vitis piasezkii]
MMKCCFKLFPHFRPIHAIVNHTIPCSISNSSWLVDLSASHHVIIDLSNLTLHYEYGGLNDIVLGDGALLLQGQNKDGVYEWMQPIFAPRHFLLAFCHP